MMQGTPCVCNRWLPMVKLSHDLRRNVRRLENDDGTPAKPYILLLQRHNDQRRYLVNFDDVMEMVDAKFPEEEIRVFNSSIPMTAREFGPLFAGAKVMMGAFGAGLSNMVFCKQGTVVIEAATQGRGNHYLVQSAALGLRFYGMSVKPNWSRVEAGRRGEPWEVDLAKLEKILRVYLNPSKTRRRAASLAPEPDPEVRRGETVQPPD